MANPKLRHPGNVEGPWFVDRTCINCDASRQCAPWMFGDVDDQAIVVRQPQTEAEERDAARAMVACPTGSIGTTGPKPTVIGLFPEELEDGVYYAGFNSRKSFGANAFFVCRRDGNYLIDSPRWAQQLAQSFSELGGITHVLLTHGDDVADAERYAAHFGARVWIHDADRSAAPFATDIISERGTIAAGLVVIPVPGHTRGSVVYLLEDKYLFSGDSVAYSRTRRRLSAFRQTCWYSWEELTRSLALLQTERFEWVLPGHGNRHHADAEWMRTSLLDLVQRMERNQG
jgi:glyoxylase-like metal-dependent hydrolase (beta-lactamase superfamily II)